MIPEPFSITLSVFATIGFLNLARQGAEATYKYSKDYGSAADDAKTIVDEAKLAEIRLDLWRRIWHMQGNTHEEYPVHLWKQDWKAIQIVTGKIEKISRDIDEILLPLLREYLAQADRPASQSVSGKRDLHNANIRGLAMREADVTRIDSSWWWGRKMNFIFHNSKKLKDLLEKYPSLFEQLDSVCNQGFYQAHPTKKTNMTYQERRDTTMTDMLVAQAIKTRPASWALHDCCRRVGEGIIELELSLLRPGVGDTGRPLQAGIPDRLCYYLTIPQPTLYSITGKNTAPQHLEILIEQKEGPGDRPESTFRGVCTELAISGSCCLRYARERLGPQAASVSFKVWKSLDPVRDSGRREWALPGFLASAAMSTGDNELSLRQRLKVAFRIAECSMLLLGTPWISNLDSTNIMRAYLAPKEDRYRLVVGPRLGEADGYDDLQTARVGKLLRELALGTNIGEYDRENELRHISTDLGPQYQQAVEFCYKVPKKNPRTLRTANDYDVFYRGILRDYFSEVVLPLAKLQQGNVSLLDQDHHALSFSPNTYLDAPITTFGGVVPTLSASAARPGTFLSSFRSTMKALSTRSASSLGKFGKTHAIVYYVAMQRFRKIPLPDIPGTGSFLPFSAVFAADIPRMAPFDFQLPTTTCHMTSACLLERATKKLSFRHCVLANWGFLLL